ncbi:MAG: CvpA family protein [Syntrophomonadaceae bacterium]|nr:CvpA family protein [Syntrophomonadaceae bacterium]MDD3271198.1 CvpA family protein [Syntrophomonadaceae bacterium]MDD4563150.1 CvpA family protein [Syntrophomonadaceae bacterium]
MQLNVLDYAIIAILLLSAWAGLRRGLFNIIGGLMGTLIGLLAAVVFHRELALYLEKHFALSTWLAGIFHEKLPLPALSPGLVKVLGYPAELADPAFYLATSLVIAISFLLILLLGSKLIQLLCKLLEGLLAHGILSGVNRGLGMGLLLLKNLLIMVVLAGVLLAPLELGARMGLPAALISTQYMHDSFLVEHLLNIFDHLKALLEIRYKQV